MPQRCYFDLVEDERTLTDPEGLLLANAASVRREAQRSAAWIAAGYGKGRRPSVAQVRVRDATGNICLEVPVG